MTRPNLPTKRKKFASYVLEARYLIDKIKNDKNFVNYFFYDYRDDCYNIGPICKIIISCLKRSYGCDVYSYEDIGTFLYVKLWDGGTWHNLDTYREEYGFFTWLFKVAYNLMIKKAEEIGYFKTKRKLTPGNTRLLANKVSPEDWEMYLDVLMPKGEHYEMLKHIYVNRKKTDEIIKKMHLADEKEYKSLRHRAENHLKTILIESEEDYEGILITEKSPRCVVWHPDYERLMEEQCVDNSLDNPIGDVVGVWLSDAEVESEAGVFLSKFVHFLKWSETDICVILERCKGTSPESLAKKLGRRRDWVDTRYSRLKKKFLKAFDLWVNHFERTHKK